MRLMGVPFEHRPWSTFGDGDKLAAYNPLRRVPTLVLDDGETLIGGASGRTEFQRLYVSYLWVDADHRGQGHGQAVIRHALAQAWASACYKVVLTTSRKDPAVWAFYERCGFASGDKRAFVIRAPAA